MINGISGQTQTQPVAQTTSANQQSQPKPAPPPKPDSVELSATAQAIAAAVKEATETPAQTAKEAGNGDRQAQRLLAKEKASKPT